MKFKNVRAESEWSSGFLLPITTAVVVDCELFLEGRGLEPTLTSVHRTPDENDALYGSHGDHLYGPHVLWHAADIRSWDLPGPVTLELLDHVNSQWIYDPKRPSMSVLIFEGARPSGSSAPHLHAQALPGVTIRKLLSQEQPVKV